MKKNIILFAILYLVGVNYTAHAQKINPLTTADFKTEIWDYSTSKEWKYLGDKPVIIYFYATWEPKCEKLTPILENIYDKYGDKIQIRSTDADKHPELVQLFNVNTLPAMIFIPQLGKPFNVTGLRPQEQLEQLISEKLNVK